MANPKPSAGFDKNPQNINTKGQPKKENSFKSIINRLFEEDYINPKTKENLGNTKELLVKAWIAHAVSGNSIGHLRELLDRTEGKVPLPIQELTDKTIDLNDIADFFKKQDKEK